MRGTVKHRWLLEWLQVRILFLFVAHYLEVFLTPNWVLGGSPLGTNIGLSYLTWFQQLESNHAFLEKEIPFQYHHSWGFCGSSQTDTATPKVTPQRTKDSFWEVKFAGDVFSDVKVQSIFSWIFQPKQHSPSCHFQQILSSVKSSCVSEVNFHLNKLMETQFCWILREVVDLPTEECEDFMLPPTPQATSPTRSDRQVEGSKLLKMFHWRGWVIQLYIGCGPPPRMPHCHWGSLGSS